MIRRALCRPCLHQAGRGHRAVVAKLTPWGVEVRCRYCKLPVTIPFDEIEAFRIGEPHRPRGSEFRRAVVLNDLSDGPSADRPLPVPPGDNKAGEKDGLDARGDSGE